MYEPYENYEQRDLLDEMRYNRPHFQQREDLVSISRDHKKPSQWVFISRQADIAIILLLFLVSCLGIMWFISQLPVFLETAWAHYVWAQELYITWGTPSMRWLFINLVVGVIVATSGLLSAFGGDSGQDSEKGRVYIASPSSSYGANETRFSGPGYQSPVYNPYIELSKPNLQHQTSFGSWNYGSEPVEQREDQEEIQESHAPTNEEPYDVPPVMSREIPGQGEAPVANDAKEILKSEGTTTSEDAPASEEIAIVDQPEDVPVSNEMSTSVDNLISGEMTTVHDSQVPVSSEIPALEHVPELEFSGQSSSIAPRGSDAVEIISKVYDPIPQKDQKPTDDGSFQRTPADPSLVLAPGDEVASEGAPGKSGHLHKSHTFTLGRVIRRDQLVDFMEPLSRKLEGLSRKIRLDPTRGFNSENKFNQSREIQVPEANNPSHARHSISVEAASQTPVPGQHMSLPEPVTHRRRNSAESFPPALHSRRLSSESYVVNRPLPKHFSREGSSRQFSPPRQFSREVTSRQLSSPPRQFSRDVASRKISPPPRQSSRDVTSRQISPPPQQASREVTSRELSPPRLLKQRSIVYPPALLSQDSLPVEKKKSAPPSPPMEEAIPPPPPPHLKLPPAVQGSSLSSVTATEELPSFKFYAPPSLSQGSAPPSEESVKPPEQAFSNEEKKPSSSKHSRNPSAHILSASLSTGGLETGSAPLTEDHSLPVKHRKASAASQEIKGVSEGSALKRPEASSEKGDDLHQQIEDFLAKFHENWRLQRQEELARYKERLREDE